MLIFRVGTTDGSLTYIVLCHPGHIIVIVPGGCGDEQLALWDQRPQHFFVKGLIWAGAHQDCNGLEWPIFLDLCP